MRSSLTSTSFINSFISKFLTVLALALIGLFGDQFIHSPTIALAEPAEYSHSNSNYEANLYKRRLVRARVSENQPIEEWIRRAIVERGKDPIKARRSYEAALKKAPEKASLWLELSKTIQAISFSKPHNYNRHQLYRDGTGASYNAYRYATSDAVKADALGVLAGFLKARSYWRPSLDAYKASLSLESNESLTKIYKELRAEKGFRITNYKMNSDLLNPRLCVQFSENLYARGTDYSTFVKINQDDPDGVRVERRQICIDGFKHGETYKVSLRQGLPSVVGEQLLKTSDLTVYVRDRSPSVRFSSKSFVLPKFGQRGLPLVSVNTKAASLALYRVGDRNLVGSLLDGQFQSDLGTYETEQLRNRFGAEVWSGKVDISTKLNKDITTAVPIGEVLPEMKPGLYVVRAWPENSKYGSNRGSTQWFIISDIGLSTLKAQNGLYGFVRSITSAEPMTDVSIRLLARNNEVLGTAKSDAKGMVHFEGGLLRGKGGNRPALLVANGTKGDYGFVDLTKAAFDLTDRGVAGRDAPGSLDGFVFTERGVYRPGEDVFLTALLRDQHANAVKDVPLTLVFTRPDGKEHKRVALTDEGAGGRSFALPLIQTAMTGTWRVQAYGDVKASPVASTSFLVEDYVPERMELTLRKDSDVWSSQAQAEVRVAGSYLYGAPAAKHQLKGDITIQRRSKGLKGFEGFEFGLANEKFLNVHKPLNNIGLLNEKGKTTLNLDLPSFVRPSKPIEAKMNIRLLEPGGRQVVRAITLPVANEKPMIGIKKLFKPSELKTGEVAEFEIVRLDKRAKRTAEVLKWELLDVQKSYQWYSQNGRWRSEPVVYTNRVAKGEITTSEDGSVKIKMPVKRGNYRLEVVSNTFNQLAASTRFSVDWYAARDADTPDILELATEKSTFDIGEKVSLTLKPQAKGKTLVAIMNEKLLDVREVSLGEEGGDIEFEVSEKWGVGAYAVAMHYHTLDETIKQMPGRAIGVKWLKTNETPRKLEIGLTLPAKQKANETLRVPVEVKGLSEGETAYVMISAVDEGILSLTNYATPRPDKHYYGQRRLSGEIRDIYGHLINGMNGTIGRIRTGGDAGGLALQGKPNSIKPVALYSGIVKVDSAGKGEISFEVPQFNGRLRVMAYAWSETKLGTLESELTVRDPIVALASMPLFLTKGDASKLFLSLDNVDAADGLYKLDVTATDKLGFQQEEFAQPIELNKGSRVNLALSMNALKLGAAKIAVKLTNDNGFNLTHSYDIHVNPPQPDASWRTVKMLSANGGKLSLTNDIFADLIPETASASVTIGNRAGLDVTGIFEALKRYPYGCAEQTTSRAMPLLYVSRIAPLYGQSIAKDLPKQMEKAIARLASLQNSQGGFGLWSPHSADMWLTAYVTDFLTRAKEQNYSVPPVMISTALARLKNTVNFAIDFSKGGEDLAYALYVLARNGEANIGDLRYYADTKIKNFSTALAQSQIAASLAMYGDQARSQAAFKVAYESIVNASELTGTGYYRRDFGTDLRDRAAILALSAEVKSKALPQAKLINAVVQARSEKGITSTQENAWMLLAANALEANDRSILLEINGEAKQGEQRYTFSPDDLSQAPFSAVNKSAEDINAVLTIHGASENPLPALEKGIGLKRQFFTLAGKEISLINAKQNDRVVVVLTISDKEHKGGRLLLTDRLPAGYMIENPKLMSSSNLRNFKWLKVGAYPTHQSFRDDKFVAAFNLSTRYNATSTRTIRVAYIMRAAFLGRYIHPAANVEDMYRPNRFARTNAQNILIERP